MKISIVIGTYNQKDNLALVLETFSQQTLAAADFEIIVVDSSSIDGTEQTIKNLSLPYSLNYLRVENRGKSFARNQGVNEARSDIILLTDADMVPDSDLLAIHITAHNQSGNIAVEGTTFNLKKQLKVEELSPQNPDVEPYIKKSLKSYQKLKWAYFLSGNLSLRKETFIKAGGFDENFSAYGWEDIELGYRLKKMKIPLIYLRQAINYHFHFVTSEDMLKRKYNMGKSAAYFYQKHPDFEIKMFLGMNPLAMGVFYLLKQFPGLLKTIKSQYILEEYQYRLGLIEGLK